MHSAGVFSPAPPSLQPLASSRPSASPRPPASPRPSFPTLQLHQSVRGSPPAAGNFFEALAGVTERHEARLDASDLRASAFERVIHELQGENGVLKKANDALKAEIVELKSRLDAQEEKLSLVLNHLGLAKSII